MGGTRNNNNNKSDNLPHLIQCIAIMLGHCVSDKTQCLSNCPDEIRKLCYDEHIDKHLCLELSQHHPMAKANGIHCFNARTRTPIQIQRKEIHTTKTYFKDKYTAKAASDQWKCNQDWVKQKRGGIYLYYVSFNWVSVQIRNELTYAKNIRNINSVIHYISINFDYIHIYIPIHFACRIPFQYDIHLYRSWKKKVTRIIFEVTVWIVL